MPTSLRLIRTLEEAGYVRQDPATKRYRLSWKMLQLQDVTASILDYADVARPYLEDLASTLGEATGMAVLDGTDVRHAIRVSSARIVAANIPPGSLFPPHATAMGKVLLAALEPGVVRELAVQRPFERFTPTTVTAVDELLGAPSRCGRAGLRGEQRGVGTWLAVAGGAGAHARWPGGGRGVRHGRTARRLDPRHGAGLFTPGPANPRVQPRGARVHPLVAQYPS